MMAEGEVTELSTWYNGCERARVYFALAHLRYPEGEIPCTCAGVIRGVTVET